MLHFTKQERVALMWLTTVFLFGSILNYVFKKYPEIVDIVNLIDNEKVYPKVDINTASAQELVQVPYIGEYTARNIINYRNKHGYFRTTEDIKAVKGVREKNYKIFSKYLKVSKARDE